MHTKGKWENNDGDIVVKVPGAWPLIAIVQYVKTMAETRANARLIAAAPDLFNTAKELLAVLDNCPGMFNYSAQLEDDLRAAVKKAEGTHGC